MDVTRKNSSFTLESPLNEAMKNILTKAKPNDSSGPSYMSEKLYMLLQLYLQNKGWNPSPELLQIFSELRETNMLPSAAQLQLLASRVIVDTQGRLVLKESGKIILPVEHFANAVMLKHMNGVHGMHLSMEATIRAVVNSYTVGKDNYGMEKEFIVEVVQNCPSPHCRYYKNQFELMNKRNEQGTSSDQQTGSSKTSSPSSTSVFGRLTSIANGLSSTTISCSGVSKSGISITPIPSTEQNATSSDSAINFTKLSNSQLETEGVSPQQPSVSLTFSKSSAKPLTLRQQQQNKLADFLKANLENLDNMSTSKETDSNEGQSGEDAKYDAAQEKIIRAFGEIMKNMAKMKSCVRPSMCKPYGKQSEQLQKTVVDTIQLVQSLKAMLPPPHIAVSSWKSDDKHGRTDRKVYSSLTGIPLAHSSNSSANEDATTESRNKTTN